MRQQSCAAGGLPPVHILEREYERLSDIVCSSPVETEAIALLWRELRRATLVDSSDAPDRLVRMRSVVRYTDLGSGEEATAQLVYSDEAAEAWEASITSPLGAALIGLQPGAVFQWTCASGEARTIRIEEVGAEIQTNAREAARRHRGRIARRATASRGGAGQPSLVRIFAKRRPDAGAERPAEWVMALDAPSFAVGPVTRLPMTFRTAEAAIAFAARRGWRYEMGGADAPASGKR
jgi:regulator of nucleoside diphosphate kinase